MQQVNEVVIRFAGDSGDGMQLTGGQFGVSTARHGNDLRTLPDFPAEIRAPQGTLGGVSSFQIHFANHDIYTAGEHVDVLVAMNPAALRVHLPSVKPGGLIITDVREYTRRGLTSAGFETSPLEDGSLDAWQVEAIDLTELATNTGKPFGLKRKAIATMRNMVALGMLGWLYSRDLTPTIEWLTAKFAHDPNVRDANIAAIRTGENFAETAEMFTTRYDVTPAQMSGGTYRQISGNQAVALGFITASHLANMDLFLGAYPITPASDVLHELAKRHDTGVLTFQAEDEIAAAGAALGASFGGALGVCTTSGPGLNLKQETIGLAVMAELPLVILDVQRAGPSTGLPTKTEQSDLLAALWGRNGDSPVPVIAASEPSDCFDAAILACRIAVEHRTPVILLSDAYLAHGSQPWLIPDVTSLEPIRPNFAVPSRPASSTDNPDDAAADAAAPEPAEVYYPYEREGLIRRWAIPGTPGFEHRLGGLEKAEHTGQVSYDALNHEAMTHLRAARIASIPVPDAEVRTWGADASTLVVGWGSTKGTIDEACQRLADEGIAVAATHLRTLNPLPANLGEVLGGYSTVIVPEVNNGQLVHLLRSTYLVDAQSWTQVRGRPLSTDALAAYLREVAR